MSRLKTITKIILIITAIILINYYSEEPKIIGITINVNNQTTSQELNQTLTLLNQTRTKATFFITETYATNNPDETRRIIREGHEISTLEEPSIRTAMMSQEAIEKRITGEKEKIEAIINEETTNQTTGQTTNQRTKYEIKGYRTPNKDLNNQTIKSLTKAGYKYDATTIKGYEWFFPPITKPLQEIPTSTLLLIPMNDKLIINTLRTGDLGYFLMAQKRTEKIIIELTPKIINEHEEAARYMLIKYHKTGAEYKTLNQLIN